jgi:hypothetical protein
MTWPAAEVACPSEKVRIANIDSDQPSLLFMILLS